MHDSEQYQLPAVTRSGGVNIVDSPFTGRNPLQRENTE